MNKKTILIGLGVLAVAGIGYYMWKKKNKTTSAAANGEDESNAAGKSIQVPKALQAYWNKLGNVGTPPQAFWAELWKKIKDAAADPDGAVVY